MFLAIFTIDSIYASAAVTAGCWVTVVDVCFTVPSRKAFCACARVAVEQTGASSVIPTNAVLAEVYFWKFKSAKTNKISVVN